MRKLITVVVFLITIIGYAQDKEFFTEPNEWWYIKTPDVNSRELYYKIADKGYVWYKWMSKEAYEIKGVEGKIKFVFLLYKIDCKSKKIGLQKELALDKEYNILDYNRNFEVRTPVANSQNEFFMNFYCEKTYLTEHYKQ